MDLNDLVNDIDSLKKRLSPKDARTLELFNEVNKILYLQVRMLATRQDLTMWYQKSSYEVLKKIDDILATEVEK